jgi:hypothetical protein
MPRIANILVTCSHFPQSTQHTTRISPRHSRLCIGEQRGEYACKSSTATGEVLPSPNGSLRSTADGMLKQGNSPVDKPLASGHRAHFYRLDCRQLGGYPPDVSPALPDNS